jgi:murein DD-endopeptidase MepM/ murein hydrolase activator NlpD
VNWQIPLQQVSATGKPVRGIVYSGDPGACAGPFSGATGSYSFIWPANNHYLSGTDFLAKGHPGIDISAPLGAPIYAADSGVVIFAGWSTKGYGNMVMLDHGNGWQTVYAHASQINVVCGQSVAQGQVIMLAGSTGNSTGSHLHFEMRNSEYGRVNPWLYLVP